MPSDEQDKAGVVAPPPLIYLGALVFGLLLGRRFPMRFLPRTMARGLGWPLLGGGCCSWAGSSRPCARQTRPPTPTSRSSA
jgi:hypothetical protein